MVEAVVDLVETVEPAAVDVDEAAVAKDIDVEDVENAEYKEELVLVAAATPAEDATSIDPTEAGEDVTETTAVEETSAVVEAKADALEAEEPTIVDTVDAVVIGKIEDEVVEDLSLIHI